MAMSKIRAFQLWANGIGVGIFLFLVVVSIKEHIPLWISLLGLAITLGSSWLTWKQSDNPARRWSPDWSGLGFAMSKGMDAIMFGMMLMVQSMKCLSRTKERTNNV